MISLLVAFFLKKFNRETKKQFKGFTTEPMEALISYSWPGNVRELENAIERAVVISQQDYISPETFILNTHSRRQEDEYSGKTLKEATNNFKKHFIQQMLSINRWNQTNTARVLGIQRTYLSRLIKELDIRR